LLAFLAGAHPNTIPTEAEKPTPRVIAPVDMTKGIPNEVVTAHERATPNTSPIKPPRRDRKIDSIRN
jgi:hypothetical protein